MEFELITTEPIGDDDIAIFCRDRENGDRYRIRVTDFEPYFYVHATQTDRARELQEEENKIRRVIDGFETRLDDEPLAKVVLYKPGDTPTVRDQFESPDHLETETWESDVPYTMRFRVDVGMRDVFEIPETMLIDEGDHWETSWTAIDPVEGADPAVEKRNFYFDIEVGGEDQATPEDDDLNPVTAITGYDTHNKTLTTWVWRDDLDREDRTETWDHPDVDGSWPWVVREFSDEDTMITNFFRYTQDNGVDVLSGWYSDKYDVPYLCRRAEELGLDPDSWSELNEVNDGLPVDAWGQAKISGLFMNDLERRYDAIVSPQSSALDNVAEEEDIMSWDQYSGSIQELWETDLDQMIRYNANDVMATRLIDEKTGITDFFFLKMYMTGCRVEEIERDSKVITYFLMFESEDDEIMPRARVHTHKQFGGGRVLLPDLQGIVGPVAVLDLSKIYPSIMISLELSYENATGVDPVRIEEPLNIVDEMPRDVFEEIRNEITDDATISGEYRQSGTRVIELEWNWDAGTVVSPLSLGKDGRMELWDQMWEMDKRGNITPDFEWSWVPPEDQDDVVLPHDHTTDLDREGDRLPNGVRIDMDHEGIITRTLEEMFEFRFEIEDEIEALDPDRPDYKPVYDRKMQKRQNAKDNINATFGYTGYKKSPLFRPEIAMTVTFVGRNILKMCEIVAQELGYQVVYGDSVTGDSEIVVGDDRVTIEDLFENWDDREIRGRDKEILDVRDEDLETPSIEEDGVVTTDQIDRIIRHKTEKQLYRVELNGDESVTVTRDHSVLIWEDGQICEVTPTELSGGERMVTYDGNLRERLRSRRKSENREGRRFEEIPGAEINRVTSVDPVETDQEWVYDLEVRDNSTFLADGVFVHNTDSIMVHLDGFDPQENMDETVYESWRVGEIVNDRMDDFAENFCGIGRDEHRFELEFEKLYETYFVGDKKKRYAGLKGVAE